MKGWKGYEQGTTRNFLQSFPFSGTPVAHTEILLFFPGSVSQLSVWVLTCRSCSLQRRFSEKRRSGLQKRCFWHKVVLPHAKSIMNLRSTHENKGFAPKNDEHDETGGCHSGKNMVYLKRGFCNPEKRKNVIKTIKQILRNTLWAMLLKNTSLYISNAGRMLPLSLFSTSTDNLNSMLDGSWSSCRASADL